MRLYGIVGDEPLIEGDQEICDELRRAPRIGDDPKYRDPRLRDTLRRLAGFNRAARLPTEEECRVALEMQRAWEGKSREPARQKKLMLATRLLWTERGLNPAELDQLLRKKREDLLKRLKQAGIDLSRRSLNRALRLVCALSAMTL